MCRYTHYLWMKKSEDYRAAIKDLEGDINDRIMREFFRRGVEGVQQPVFYKGAQVSTQLVFDTPALIALAKARMPKKFRENWKGHIQLDGGVDHHVRHEALLAPEMLDQLLEAANRLNLGNDGHSDGETEK